MAHILINDVTPRVQYTATASQTTFSYTFPIFEDSDIVVDIDDTIQTLTTHYTVTGAGADAGGTVVLVTPATGGEIVTIYRDVPTERVTDYQPAGDFLANTVNDDLDRIITMIQQVEETSGRALSLAINAVPGGVSLEFGTPVADGIFAWDSAGTAVEYLTGASVTHPYLAACLQAQTDAETAETGAQTAETNAQTEVTYAAEWANKAEDSLVSAAAGGDVVDDYSALHWANKAATSAAAAAAALDDFDDTYLGDKASNPTVDNDGDALQSGALYYNTTTDTMMVYTGSAWVPATSTIEGVLERFTYTATASQTVFTGADDNAAVLAFDAGLEQIFLNGAMLKLTTDYTLSGGDTVTLVTGATVGDILEVYAWGNLASGAIGTTVQAQDATLQSIADTGGLNVGKNLIINGGFDIWQRDTTQTTSGYGSSDRWRNAQNVSTKTTSQQTFTVGQTDVPNNPTYYTRTVATTGSGSAHHVNMHQKVEFVQRLSGKTLTMSFWAKADAAKDIATEWEQDFGSGGSPSAAVTGLVVTTHSLTTSWQKFTVTGALPSISGKTLGTNNDDHTGIRFWFEAGTTYDARTNTLGNQSGTFDIANVQLELGSAATDFEQRPIGHELALCQRYYRRVGQGMPCVGLAAGNGVRVFGHFENDMRATPTVTLLTTTPDVIVGSTTHNGTASTLSGGAASIRGMYNQVISGMTGVTANGAGQVATSELLDADAEL